MATTLGSSAPVTATPTGPCRREKTRVVIARASTVRSPDEAPCDVTVEDLSPAGFLFTSAIPIPTGAPVHVGLAGAGRASALVVWRKGDRHGCAFRPALTAAQVEAAFTHENVAAIASFAPAGAAVLLATAAPVLRISPLARLALIAAGSGLGWVAIAAGLHRLG